MNIINIDVDEKEAKVVYTFIPFILDILEKIEKNADAHFSVTHFLKQQDPKIVDDYKIWQVDDFDYENISHFAHTIPIYLRKTKPDETIDLSRFKDEDFYDIFHVSLWELQNKISKKNSVFNRDLLGKYYHLDRKSSPHIELFPTRIIKAAGDKNKSMWLFTKVLLHELSHAVIDIYNIRGFKSTNRMPYNDEFGRWREESMANAITLSIIKKYGTRDFYKYSLDFMKKQPHAYRLGIKIKDVEHWGLRSIYINKLYGVKKDLAKKWLKYVKKTPTVPGMKEWDETFSRKYKPYKLNGGTRK